MRQSRKGVSLRGTATLIRFSSTKIVPNTIHREQSPLVFLPGLVYNVTNIYIYIYITCSVNYTKWRLYGNAVTSRPYILSLKIVNIFSLNLVFGGLELNGRNSLFFVPYRPKINVNLQPQIVLKQFYITTCVTESQQNETYGFTGIFTYDLQLVSDSFSTVHNKHGISGS
jgi:hypothetical protein